MSNFDFKNADVSKLTQEDFDNLDLNKLSPAEIMKVVILYRTFLESKAIPAYKNMEPYSLGNEDPIEAFKKAGHLYMLCVTNVGMPSTMTFDGEKCVLVALKPYMIEDDEYVGLIEFENKTKKEQMYLYQCDQHFVLSQMHNFKCDHIKLIDTEDWYRIYEYDLEDAE